MALIWVTLSLLVLATVGVERSSTASIPKLEKNTTAQSKKDLYPGTVADKFPPSKSVLGRYAKQAVAADSVECSEMGNDVLKKGGNAIEAAITTSLCVGIYDPQSCGLGGGHFMVIYNRKNQSATTINAREMAPAASTTFMYVDNKNISSIKGWHAAGVPGELAGLWAAYQYSKSVGGKLQWKDLFAPVIKALQQGIRINNRLAFAIRVAKDDILGGYDKGLTTLFAPGGRLLVENQTYANEKLVNTMQMIADDPEGIKEFYTGRIAENLVNDIKNGGGIITLDDMQQYTAAVEPAIHTTLQDNSLLYTIPPPSSGLILQYMVKVMDGYYGNVSLDWRTAKQTDRDLFNQRLVETMKYGYARRTELGDKDFQAEVQEIEEALLNPWLADFTRRSIMENKTSNDTSTYGVKTVAKIGKTGTSHLCVLDKDGNAVSLTTTINTFFGSRRLSQSTGILLNNEMDDFSVNPNEPNFYGLPPSKANYVAPHKRPQSSISGTIVADRHGDVTYVIGASGGSRIISATASVLMRAMYLGLNIKEAIDHPRLHHQLLPMHLEYEPGTRRADVVSLVQKGHKVDTSHMQEAPYAAVQGIHRLADGSLEANSDFRKGGRPAGE
ncbi:scoloptoxin SSD14-like [Paramacrobiotus metropolitanus]|uniref:scoloptoxin SSD14-like n=1 Tax=Paramacrobiotus metropolitanus TaxID=2943436 RepID=UPI002445AF3A|nr:scoloptoxin SSD14-like [Paramacrobiotus metropolitanus]